jgi:phage head maturation protease
MRVRLNRRYITGFALLWRTTIDLSAGAEHGKELAFHPGAFDKILRDVHLGQREIRAVLNHREQVGSTQDGSLQLSAVLDGLRFGLAFSSDTAAGRRLWTGWEMSAITGCSLSYTVRCTDETRYRNGWGERREVKEVSGCEHVSIEIFPELPASPETRQHVHACRL